MSAEIVGQMDDENVYESVLMSLQEGQMSIEDAEETLADRFGDMKAKELLSDYKQFECEDCQDTGYVTYDMLIHGEGFQKVKARCHHKAWDEANAKVKEAKENE